MNVLFLKSHAQCLAGRDGWFPATHTASIDILSTRVIVKAPTLLSGQSNWL